MNKNEENKKLKNNENNNNIIKDKEMKNTETENNKITKSKMKIFKIFILLLFIAVIAFLIIKIGPIFKNISTEEGRIEFQKEIESFGFKGILAILGLMFVQIFLFILPGEPVELLAGMCYGPIGGMLVIFLGVFLTTCLIYFSVRKFGKAFIYNFVSKKEMDKLENSQIWKNTKKIETVLFISFFIPGTPKDIFTYIGGLLPIKPVKFILISTFARFPSIISSTIAGSNLVYGNWKVIIITYAITFAIAGILIFLLNRKKSIEKVEEVK